MNTIVDESFFVIDSDNLNEVKSHLYGYLFTDRQGYANCCPPDETFDDNCPGFYTIVTVDEKSISLCGSFSQMLFLYRDTDLTSYFCISNSFWKLCQHVVKKKHSLSLDRLFAKQYLTVGMSSIFYKNTLAKEITILPLFAKVTINKKSGKLYVNEGDVLFETIPIDSYEGMKVLDEWISKWGSLLKAIYKSGLPIHIDLSGGYDSRTALMLAYAAGIDLNDNNVTITSFKSETTSTIKKTEEDYKIAGNIAELLGTHLNQNFTKGIPAPAEYAYKVFKYAFLGFHTEGRFSKDIFYDCNKKLSVFSRPVFRLSGFYGEPLRGKYCSLDFWMKKLGKYNSNNVPLYKYYLSNLREERDRTSSEIEVMRKFYLQSRGRNHFGALQFYDFSLGRYDITPFSDMQLYKIEMPKDIDKDAIFALIIARVCPALLEIPFANNSDFSLKTKEYVRLLCKKYPSLICIRPNDISLETLKKRSEKFKTIFESLNANNEIITGETILYQKFCDGKNRNLFLSEFGNNEGNKLIEAAEAFFNNKNVLFYSRKIVPIVGIMDILTLCSSSEKKQNEVKEYFCGIDNVEQRFLQGGFEHTYQEEIRKLKLTVRQKDKQNAENLKQLKSIKKQAANLSRDLKNVKNGWSFRIGRVITFVPRKIKSGLSRVRNIFFKR